MIELKPCTSCGSADVATETKITEGWRKYYAWCLDCGVERPYWAVIKGAQAQRIRELESQVAACEAIKTDYYRMSGFCLAVSEWAHEKGWGRITTEVKEIARAHDARIRAEAFREAAIYCAGLGCDQCADWLSRESGWLRQRAEKEDT